MNIYHSVYESNRDLLTRVKKEKIFAKYLKKEDVFLVNFGKPKTSFSITLPDGLIIIHYDPKNYKITGFTVPYLKEFLDSCKQLAQNEELEKNFEKHDYKPLAEPVANVGMTGLSFAF